MNPSALHPISPRPCPQILAGPARPLLRLILLFSPSRELPPGPPGGAGLLGGQQLRWGPGQREMQRGSGSRAEPRAEELSSQAGVPERGTGPEGHAGRSGNRGSVQGPKPYHISGFSPRIPSQSRKEKKEESRLETAKSLCFRRLFQSCLTRNSKKIAPNSRMSVLRAPEARSLKPMCWRGWCLLGTSGESLRAAPALEAAGHLLSSRVDTAAPPGLLLCTLWRELPSSPRTPGSRVRPPYAGSPPPSLTAGAETLPKKVISGFPPRDAIRPRLLSQESNSV